MRQPRSSCCGYLFKTGRPLSTGLPLSRTCTQCAWVDRCQEPSGKNKYRAQPNVDAEGNRFDSKAERARYEALKLLQKAGEISNLTLHPSWELEVNGVKIGGYTADASYMMDGRLVVEDTKGVRTRDYILRKKLMLACHGIEVQEYKAKG